MQIYVCLVNHVYFESKFRNLKKKLNDYFILTGPHPGFSATGMTKLGILGAIPVVNCRWITF
jgi:hypothetical protein